LTGSPGYPRDAFSNIAHCGGALVMVVGEASPPWSSQFGHVHQTVPTEH
jgi:hypothetical protein